jgi:hypothetical protein
MKLWAVTPILFLGLAWARPSLAQGDFSIEGEIIGAGGTSTGGTYTLSGVIGQFDAGTLTGGGYTLQGGFLPIVASAPAGACGDATLDGTVDVTDAILVLRHIVGLDSLTPAQVQTADVAKDGAIDVNDAIKILRIVVQLEPPC